MKTIVRNIFIAVSITIGGIYLLGSAIWFGHLKKNSDSKLVRYDILDSNERQYVNEKELNELLSAEGLYPIAKDFNQQTLQKIENTILNHPMVRTAECYQTTDGNIMIELTQRVPLVRILTANESYFIDTDLSIMPVRSSVKDKVLTAEGNIGKRTATNEIAEFVKWLQHNKYWKERVMGIRVRAPHEVLLVQQKGQPHILLGDLKDYETKLARVKALYENGFERMAEVPHYQELDARYDQQIIGRK